MKDTYKILWAEDEESLREVMCELIMHEGYQCTPVKDGLEAMERLKKDHFDLLIIDFNMPQMGGVPLLFWCRENQFHQPVIFVTGAPERKPIEELVLKDCCTSIINKPFSIEVLVDEIEKARKRNHDFDCKGATVPLSETNFEENFPGQHYLKN